MEKCPNCGAPLELKNSDKARMKFCSFCSTQIDLVSSEHRVLSKYAEKPAPPKSALKLGDKGSINNITYQIIGRIRYRDTRNYAWWDEWLMLSESGQYLWLVEDDWEFILTHKYTPKVPTDPNTVGQYFDIDGMHLEVEDNSDAVVQFFEGELTWKAEVGETIHYLDAWKGEDTLYSVEWTDREILYFIGKDIPATAIYNSFGLGKPPAEALEEDDDEADSPAEGIILRMMKGPAFGQCVLFGLLLMILALVFNSVGINVTPQSGIQSVGENFLMGPYELKNKGVYKFDTRFGGLSNSSRYFEFEILDSDKKEVANFDAEFYHESGYEDGESYTETNYQKDVKFYLEDPGKYYIRIIPEKGKNASGLTINVKEGAFDVTPLWVAGLVILAYPGLVLLFYLMSQSSESDD